MTLGQALRGRIIAESYEESDGENRSVVLQLDNGQKVVIKMEGGPGADSEWYQWLTVKVNGELVFRG